MGIERKLANEGKIPEGGMNSIHIYMEDFALNSSTRGDGHAKALNASTRALFGGKQDHACYTCLLHVFGRA